MQLTYFYTASPPLDESFLLAKGFCEGASSERDSIPRLPTRATAHATAQKIQTRRRASIEPTKAEAGDEGEL